MPGVRVISSPLDPWGSWTYQTEHGTAAVWVPDRKSLLRELLDMRGRTFWVLADIAVHPTYRRQGEGTRLLRALCAQADASSAVVFLSVAADAQDPDPARLFEWYEKHGWQRVRHPGDDEESLLMLREPA